jgi:hypothetical protein
MYISASRGRRSYYRCGSHTLRARACGNRSILAEEAEQIVGAVFTVSELGAQLVTRRVFVPGDGRAGRMAEVEAAIEELLADQRAGIYRSEIGRNAFTRMMTSLNDEAADLEASPPREDEWVEEETRQTMADAWDGLETVGERNGMLREQGVTVVISSEPVPYGLGRDQRVGVHFGGRPIVASEHFAEWLTEQSLTGSS